MGDLPDNSCFQHPFGSKEHTYAAEEIRRLIKKEVVIVSKHDVGQFISPIFVRPKHDGLFRLILNLRKLNEITQYIHFKMETLSSVLRLVTPMAYMAKIDIKDAYYSVPIKLEDQKLLKFKFDNVLYQFTSLPNGYSEGPRKFTKLLKPPLAALRKAHVTLAAYLDDIFTLGKTKAKCSENIFKIMELFQSLGFIIHPEKSIFEPTTTLEFLGFIIDSMDITVSLTIDKKVSIKTLCTQTLTSEHNTVRDIACLLGKFSSSFIAVPQGKLHFRNLERNKTKALIINKGNFDKQISLSNIAKAEIAWWEDHIMHSFAPIIRDNPTIVITTDASLLGWGRGACGLGKKTGGHFTTLEKEVHINVLESKAVLFGLQAVCGDINNQHIKVLVDNSATVGAINNKGSSKSVTLDTQTKEIWEWVLDRKNWLTASHIPGVLNVEADKESRKTETRSEWKLNSEVFQWMINTLNFSPIIDLFASRINTQLPRFVAFRPDPVAETIYAFSISWDRFSILCFSSIYLCRQSHTKNNT